MNAHDFAYWLQGFAELSDAPPSAEQWQSIRDHLGLVFEKRTPPLQQAGIPNQWPPQPRRGDLPYIGSPQCAASPLQQAGQSVC